MTNPPTSAIFNDLETEKKKKHKTTTTTNTLYILTIHCLGTHVLYLCQ